MNIALHDPNGNMGVPPALKVKEKGNRQSRKTERGQKEDGRERESDPLGDGIVPEEQRPFTRRVRSALLRDRWVIHKNVLYQHQQLKSGLFVPMCTCRGWEPGTDAK